MRASNDNEHERGSDDSSAIDATFHQDIRASVTADDGEPIQWIPCQWCKSMNEKTELNCRSCAAPLDLADLVSESGWREAPRIRDMAQAHFGNSTCQVEGEIVPVAEIYLAEGDAVFFEHRLMLWKDQDTRLSIMPIRSGVTRTLAGMPFIITLAHGPGRIAFSRDQSGELVVLPLQPGMEIDVREHSFVLASREVDYSYVRIKGLRNILFGGQGMFMDRFVASKAPGLLVLHGYGNVLQRTLKAGESIMVEPGAFLYKDASVTMDVQPIRLSTGWFARQSLNMAKMTGPGRIAIQSMYVHHESKEDQ